PPLLPWRGYPFRFGFPLALIIATGVAGLLGVILGAPTLRLRGDYLALVTLGFGEVVRFAIRNLEEITGGTKGLNPVPPPTLPFLGQDGQDYRVFYFLSLGLLLLVVLLLWRLEKTAVGPWVRGGP